MPCRTFISATYVVALYAGAFVVLGYLQIYARVLIIRLEARAEYWKHFRARFDGVHAFGYNSIESEPIWMRSGELFEYIVCGWP